MKAEILKQKVSWSQGGTYYKAKKGDVVEISDSLFGVWEKQGICRKPVTKKKASK